MNERTSNPGGATSGQGGQKQEKTKFRMESQQERTAKAKLQMEKRWDKLETARNRLANQKPPQEARPPPAGGRGRRAWGTRLCAWQALRGGA